MKGRLLNMKDMNEIFRSELISEMQGILDNEQISYLGDTLMKMFTHFNVEQKSTEVGFCDNSNANLKKRFIASLRLEGKSEQTLDQYSLAIDMLYADIDKDVTIMTTNDIRYHLAIYQSTRKVSKRTVDNKRRNLSAYFSWLAREEFIDKNPMIRIAKIKTEKTVKLPFTDNDIEKLQDAVQYTNNPLRNRAIIEFLLTTGCRVSELLNLDINNVNFIKNECIVLGKGNKQRKVYISDKAMYHINEYLKTRKVNSDILFVNKNGKRMSKQAVEKILKVIAKYAGVSNVHPHRFRRTFATNALNKGMPVQHLQRILGHTSLDTTMIYCCVDEDEIKLEHKRIA